MSDTPKAQDELTEEEIDRCRNEIATPPQPRTGKSSPFYPLEASLPLFNPLEAVLSVFGGD